MKRLEDVVDVLLRDSNPLIFHCYLNEVLICWLGGLSHYFYFYFYLAHFLELDGIC